MPDFPRSIPPLYAVERGHGNNIVNKSRRAVLNAATIPLAPGGLLCAAGLAAERGCEYMALLDEMAKVQS